MPHQATAPLVIPFDSQRYQAAIRAAQKNVDDKITPTDSALCQEFAFPITTTQGHLDPELDAVASELKLENESWKQRILAPLRRRIPALIKLSIAGNPLYTGNEAQILLDLFNAGNFDRLEQAVPVAEERLVRLVKMLKALHGTTTQQAAQEQFNTIRRELADRRTSLTRKDCGRGAIFTIDSKTELQRTTNLNPESDELKQEFDTILANITTNERIKNYLREYTYQGGLLGITQYFQSLLTDVVQISPQSKKFFVRFHKREDGVIEVTLGHVVYSYVDTSNVEAREVKSSTPVCVLSHTVLIKEPLQVELGRCCMEVRDSTLRHLIETRSEQKALKNIRQGKPLSNQLERAAAQRATQRTITQHTTNDGKLDEAKISLHVSATDYLWLAQDSRYTQTVLSNPISKAVLATNEPNDLILLTMRAGTEAAVVAEQKGFNYGQLQQRMARATTSDAKQQAQQQLMLAMDTPERIQAGSEALSRAAVASSVAEERAAIRAELENILNNQAQEKNIAKLIERMKNADAKQEAVFAALCSFNKRDVATIIQHLPIVARLTPLQLTALLLSDKVDANIARQLLNPTDGWFWQTAIKKDYARHPVHFLTAEQITNIALHYPQLILEKTSCLNKLSSEQLKTILQQHPKIVLSNSTCRKKLNLNAEDIFELAVKNAEALQIIESDSKLKGLFWQASIFERINNPTLTAEDTAKLAKLYQNASPALKRALSDRNVNLLLPANLFNAVYKAVCVQSTPAQLAAQWQAINAGILNASHITCEAYQHLCKQQLAHSEYLENYFSSTSSADKDTLRIALVTKLLNLNNPELRLVFLSRLGPIALKQLLDDSRFQQLLNKDETLLSCFYKRNAIDILLKVFIKIPGKRDDIIQLLKNKNAITLIQTIRQKFSEADESILLAELFIRRDDIRTIIRADRVLLQTAMTNIDVDVLYDQLLEDDSLAKEVALTYISQPGFRKKIAASTNILMLLPAQLAPALQAAMLNASEDSCRPTLTRFNYDANILNIDNDEEIKAALRDANAAQVEAIALLYPEGIQGFIADFPEKLLQYAKPTGLLQLYLTNDHLRQQIDSNNIVCMRMLREPGNAMHLVTLFMQYDAIRQKILSDQQLQESMLTDVLRSSVAGHEIMQLLNVYLLANQELRQRIIGDETRLLNIVLNAHPVQLINVLTIDVTLAPTILTCLNHLITSCEFVREQVNRMLATATGEQLGKLYLLECQRQQPSSQVLAQLRQNDAAVNKLLKAATADILATMLGQEDGTSAIHRSLLANVECCKKLLTAAQNDNAAARLQLTETRCTVIKQQHQELTTQLETYERGLLPRQPDSPPVVIIVRDRSLSIH